MSARSTVMPWAANQAWARRQNAGGGDGLFVVEDLGVGEAGAVVEGGVDEPVADRWSASPVGAWPRPWIRQPPPVGMPEIFLTSTWTSSPGRSRW